MGELRALWRLIPVVQLFVSQFFFGSRCASTGAEQFSLYSGSPEIRSVGSVLGF